MQTRRDGPSGAATSAGLIDCDVHVTVPNVQALFPYLPQHWVEHVNQSVFKGAVATYYPPRSPVAARPGSAPPDGPAGSSLDLLQSQVLDPLGVDIAIANCLYAIDSLHNPEAAVAFARATNDWLIAEWLDKEPRLRASIVVPAQLPELAAAEIARVAGHPGFVQVLLPVRSEHPYGSRLHRPLWEAIVRHDLVAGIHFGGAPGNPPFPSGWPSHYIEEYAGMAQVFQSQLASIVSEGVLDLFPDVRIALLESGFTWLPAFMWRFDKEWHNLRRLVPWVKRAPSEYIREHVRATVQPLDMPPEWRDMEETIAQIDGEQMLLYASDYPHQHTADPLTAFLPRLPEPLTRKIRHENAMELYGLSLGAAPAN
jgi:predicted TIM-barrel fold metal-dependent hydrolase